MSEGNANNDAARRADTPDETSAMWRGWFDAARRPEMDQAIADLYRRIGESVAQRGPVCWASGRCCNFDAYGHRLYVTGLETAWVLERVHDRARTDDRSDARVKALPITDVRGRCVYQVDGLCSIHDARPMGCRVFFCQRGTETWQHDLYERYLGELKAMHDASGLPYRYMEWRAALAAGIEHREASAR